MTFLLHFLATLLLFLSLDVIWLKFLIGGMVEYPYVVRYGNSPNWALAEIYYVVMSIRLAYCAAYKGLVYDNAAPAFLDGWKMGFRFSVVYAAINVLFIYAWPFQLIVLDIVWNTFATSMAAVASYAIGNWLTSSGSQVTRV